MRRALQSREAYTVPLTVAGGGIGPLRDSLVVFDARCKPQSLPLGSLVQALPSHALGSAAVAAALFFFCPAMRMAGDWLSGLTFTEVFD